MTTVMSHIYLLQAFANGILLYSCAAVNKISADSNSWASCEHQLV